MVEGEESLSIPRRSIQALKGFLSTIQDISLRSQEMSATDIIDVVVESTGYREYILADEDGDERWENVMELRTVAQQYGDLRPGESLKSFLEGVALVSDVDNYDETADAVTLITLHQSKGLEFSCVFIVGMEEKVFPHARCLEDPMEMEEERRLCYVGITRARERLYLTRALQRMFLGSRARNLPSRFIEDIPARLVTRPGFAAERVAMEVPVTATPFSVMSSRSYLRQPSSPAVNIRLGDVVRHDRFGDGVVVEVQPSGDDHEVTVSFEGGATKRLLLSYARLQKVG
jgi:DNA helicase-2/ATP-dependent DNA helicase PcrA